MDKIGGTIGALVDWGIASMSAMFDAVGNPVKSGVTRFKGTVTHILSGVKSMTKKVVICVVLFIVILWVASLLYASFYHIYVPTASILRPAHFKFRVCPHGAGMCSFPMANVTLGADNRAEVLGRGQQYRVFLEMQVPDSTPNRDVGMFMVVSRMYDRYGLITQESSRAVSLKYQSDLLKIIQTVVLSPLYIIGFAEEIQTLKIELFDDLWDDYYQPSVGVLLEIHSRQLVFYSTQLQFHANYVGLRYYLFYYPFSSAFLGILFNCLWLTPAVLIPWCTLGLGPMESLNGKAREQGTGVPRTGDGPGEARRRGGAERRDSAELEPDEKEEEDIETVPRL